MTVTIPRDRWIRGPGPGESPGRPRALASPHGRTAAGWILAAAGVPDDRMRGCLTAADVDPDEYRRARPPARALVREVRYPARRYVMRSHACLRIDLHNNRAGTPAREREAALVAEARTIGVDVRFTDGKENAR